MVRRRLGSTPTDVTARLPTHDGRFVGSRVGRAAAGRFWPFHRDL